MSSTNCVFIFHCNNFYLITRVRCGRFQFVFKHFLNFIFDWNITKKSIISFLLNQNFFANYFINSDSLNCQHTRPDDGKILCNRSQFEIYDSEFAKKILEHFNRCYLYIYCGRIKYFFFFCCSAQRLSNK